MKKYDKRGQLSLLFINPPRSPYNGILQFAPDDAKRFIHKKLIGPPLGLLTVATAVRDHAVSFLDMKGEYDLHPDAPDIEQLTWSWLEDSNPHLVGVTFIASEFNDGMRIFKTVKKFNPDIVTVAGGLHTTLCPEHFFDDTVDVVIPGMATQIFREVVDAVSRRRDLRSVAGILVRGAAGLEAAAVRNEMPDPAREGFIAPDRSLVKPWIDTYIVGNNTVPVTYLYTSLGCPYRCTFCSIWPQCNGRFYQRDIESIIEELKGLDGYPIVRFADANTVVNASFIHRLFDRILEEQIRKEYVMDIRFDTVVQYPELIEKMAGAGLKVVICGFESFRQHELERYGKKASARQISEAIRIFDMNGIQVRGNYVVPPDYGDDDFKALEEYAASHKVVYAGYTILTPMPGTQLYKQNLHDIIDYNLARYNFFNCVMRTTLPLEEFYHRVGRLWVIKKGTDVI